MQIALMAYRLKNRLASALLPSRTAEKAFKKFLTPRRQQPKEWELRAEASGTRFNISAEISAIRWLPEVGSADKKVLLVHGWESRATQMSGFVPDLLAQGYEVIAIDMPAHGKSEGHMADADKFAKTILLTEQVLGRFDAVIAHSLGAGATSIALSRGLNSDRLVLISGPSSIENVLRRFSGFIGLSTAATDYFVKFVSTHVGVEVEQLDAVRQLQDIQVPTLIIHDRDDREVPASESERLLPSFSNGQLVLTEGFGHRHILKSQMIKEKVIAFLNEAPEQAQLESA